MKIIILALALTSPFALADLPVFPHIIVKGHAEKKVAPTQAKINFVVSEFNADPKIAQDIVAKRMQAILNLAEKYKISRDNIVLQTMDKTTKRKSDDHYNSLEILGYEISQSVEVEIDNINLYPGFADELIASRNVTSIRSDFKVSSEVDERDELIKVATQNAKTKAEKLAQGMDVKLGGVFAVSQDVDYASSSATYGYMSLKEGSPPPDFVPPPSLDFVPDESGSFAVVPKYIELSASVSAIYKIK